MVTRHFYEVCGSQQTACPLSENRSKQQFFIFHKNFLREHPIPEMLSSPLENIILKAKLLNMGSPKSLLALALDKPSLSDIGNTILLLKETGALLLKSNGVMNDLDGDISFIGRIMANLPVDVKIAKFIILGYCFSVLEECITIGEQSFQLKN